MIARVRVIQAFQVSVVRLHAAKQRPVSAQEIADYLGWNVLGTRGLLRRLDLEPLGIELSCIEGPGAHSPDVGLHVGSRPLPRYSPTPALVKCIPWQEPLVPDTKAVNAALAAEAATCDLEAAALTENAARLRMQASCDHQWVRSESHARWTCGICGCSATGEVPG